MSSFEPGLLEKLFDDRARSPTTAVLRSLSAEEVKSGVARDLEALLNTRMVFSEDMLAGFPECKRSILTYGLSDFSGLSLASHYDRAFVCRSIEYAIERHEPRLKEVVVALDLSRQETTGSLRLTITAILTLPGLREPVNFDALLQPATLQYAVTRGSPGKSR
jgi:type VI secretion system protein ImpF